MSRPSTYTGLLISLLVVNPTGLVQAGESQPIEALEVVETEIPESHPPLTSEQREFVSWGEARFADAGLTLPEVEYVFHDDLEECGWHGGKYRPSTRTVTMCNADPKTLIHELAHAWETTRLTDETRNAFMELRGLTEWTGRSVPWSERGAEQVAEVITWGVEEASRLVPWTEPDGSITFRLLSIDASVEELLTAYRLLTGQEPVLRNPQEWQQPEWDDFSPEAARFSGGPESRQIG